MYVCINLFASYLFAGGGDYWDARICHSFKNSCLHFPPLGIRIFGLTQVDDYQDWVRENYSKYKDFIDFWFNPDNTTGKLHRKELVLV